MLILAEYLAETEDCSVFKKEQDKPVIFRRCAQTRWKPRRTRSRRCTGWARPEPYIKLLKRAD